MVPASSQHSEADAFALGLPLMQQSLAMAEQRGDPIFPVGQLNTLACSMMRSGDWQRARNIHPYAEAKTLRVYGQLEAACRNVKAARQQFTATLVGCLRLGEGLYGKHIERDLAALNGSLGPPRP
jgi:hypothetical protein